MEALVTVKQMRERYGCSNPTARKYLRQCTPHMENPLVAPEWAVREWEEGRMVEPVSRVKVNARWGGMKIVVPRKR